ncbi:hypothetical protein [Tsukamurella tyrosinosolvens]|uniref:hypothetical protein n=1 Tax=Tsukamurella tyrosinosolvens TaxID=57704 RepID=UPI002DD42C98|nr:hypothetical protein [Tsukamurella tyrosinosolvens]MEC4615780.1 hypothetical protein [Tsukamurella tyrosinosolvens]
MSADLIVALGGGGAIGAIVVALIGAIAGRGKSRAEAAKILTDTAASLTATVSDQLAKCNAKVDALQEAVEHLTDRVDEALPLLEADHPQTHRGLRDANAAVKRAL